MVQGSENRALNPHVESSRESQAIKPDLRADNLLKEHSAVTATQADRPNPISADGKQLVFTSPYPDQGLGINTDRSQTPAGNGDAPGGKSAQDKAATLFSKDATDEQKLATVRDLAKSGVTELNYRDGSGHDHKLRLELESAGKQQMVHLFTQGADGKEHTALRGISKADGSFEHERDRSGKFVDYHGRGHADLMSEQPSSPGAVTPGGKDQAIPRGLADKTIPGTPEQTLPGAAEQQGKRGRYEQPNLPIAPDGSIGGTIDRSQFDSQLNDPKVMAAFAGRMRSEVGTQGKDAQIAFAEEVMNRASARNQTLMQALSGSYYPTSHPGRSNNPDFVDSVTTAWKQGTDTTHGATGNASGTVGFGVRGGHYDGNHHWVSPNQTARIGGERFGHEQVDINNGWLAKYDELKNRGSIAARERNNDSAPRV